MRKGEKTEIEMDEGREMERGLLVVVVGGGGVVGVRGVR